MSQLVAQLGIIACQLLNELGANQLALELNCPGCELVAALSHSISEDPKTAPGSALELYADSWTAAAIKSCAAIGWQFLVYSGILLLFGAAIVGATRESSAELDPNQFDFSEHEVEETKECPRCAETIKKKALVCRFCGHEFTDKENE